MGQNEKLVLVAVIRRKKDLEIALKKCWYRMPLKSAPKKKADFLAFYQTRVFGKSGKSINYYARIKGSSLVLRRQLLPEEGDHPRADDVYCKLDLNPLKMVPRRIENRTRRRISFGFTTLEKLLKTNEVSQLFSIIPIEEIMRKVIEANGIKAAHEYCLMEKGRCRYRLDFAVFCQKGKIDVECDNEKWHSKASRRIKDKQRDRWLKKQGWVILRLPGKQIRDSRKSCIKSLKKTIKKLGGTRIII